MPLYKFRDLSLKIVPIITFLVFPLNKCAAHWDTKLYGNDNIMHPMSSNFLFVF